MNSLRIMYINGENDTFDDVPINELIWDGRRIIDLTDEYDRYTDEHPLNGKGRQDLRIGVFSTCSTVETSIKFKR